MSSDTTFNQVSASDMELIQSVLDDAGYDANVLAVDQSHFNTAALLVMKLFLAGETSPYALTAQLERNFGKATENRAPDRAPLPRYAIQGLPRHLSGTGLMRPRQSAEPDLQAWENEGGAISIASRSRALPIRSAIFVGASEAGNV